MKKKVAKKVRTKTRSPSGPKKASARVVARGLEKKSKPAAEREGYHLPVRSETEQFEGLPEDLQDAWTTLRAFLVHLGPQEKIRTSHRSIMFSRRTCYAFVRPKKKHLELNFFLPMALDSELIKKTEAVSKTKFVNVFLITHADHVSEPLTDWLREAFAYSA